ncbi:MAG: regulatory iron-sulfur-containing complex subunit RicT [Patescibacteria group bacterium]|nr:regulatory iron-sulfur-containing complex subunit RicT [Patescibacteria group bacterium]
MKISVEIFPLDNLRIYDSGNWGVEVGDIVIVNTDFGLESAEVKKINVDAKTEECLKITRKVTSIDIETIEKNKQKSKEAIDVCKNLVRECGLFMKIVGVHFSFDGGKITFLFIAEKRVDFRDLVRMLSKRFQKSIRLQQVGSRDEARGIGGFGVCGRELCCAKFLGSLKSVTTEDAKVQQIGQRGSDRISGLCGRLKCCLGFEAEQYRENLKNASKLKNSKK